MGCRSFSGRVSGLTGRPSRKACQGVRPLVVVAQEEGIKRGLQVDLADPLQHPDEERVDRDQGTGVRSFDVALTELGCHPVGMRTPSPPVFARSPLSRPLKKMGWITNHVSLPTDACIDGSIGGLSTKANRGLAF